MKPKIGLEEMTDLSTELELSINDIFCGYLRQPIDVRKGFEYKYIIGQCSNRKGYRCVNEIGKDKPFNPCSCPFYNVRDKK
jgi:hypothetical protein